VDAMDAKNFSDCYFYIWFYEFSTTRAVARRTLEIVDASKNVLKTT